jgi:LmbE family N-acetylglucosaminyl deacetylase
LQLKSFTDVTPNYQHIYLSPHFDDVVYSCGGTIGMQARSGQRPLVITIFAGVPPLLEMSSFALKMHTVMGFGSDVQAVIATRRKEDAHALEYLHADYLWLDYVDALYRGTPAYYTRSDMICGSVHPGDLEIERRLSQDLLMLYERLPHATWYVPLGVGLHVDHQLVASAASRLLHGGANIKFYEDFPYAKKACRLWKRLRQVGFTLHPVQVEVSEMLQARQQAAEMYASQIRLNFGSSEAMYKAMKAYTRRMYHWKMVHMERYWIYAQG